MIVLVVDVFFVFVADDRRIHCTVDDGSFGRKQTYVDRIASHEFDGPKGNGKGQT